MRFYINSFVASVGSLITYLLGGWDKVLSILVVLMVLDYVSGVLSAIHNKDLNSMIGFRGILKKVIIIIVLIVAVLLDRLLNNEGWVFRTLVAFYYIANECISILENAGKTGLEIHPKLIEVLKQLKEGK